MVQSLSRKLREGIENHREFLAEKGAKIRLQEIMDCLELAELDIRYYISADSDGTGYLDSAMRNYPDLKKDGSSDSGIILAG